MAHNSKEPILLIDSHHGIYLPKVFCEVYANLVEQEQSENLDICLAGPDHEDYWDAWEDILDTTHFTEEGVKYSIGSIGEENDLWAIPEGYEYDESF